MATYLPKYRGVSLSLALAEAASIAPQGYAILSTFEIRHPLITTIRFVHNPVDIVARLEATAPQNAGQQVLFKACHVRRTIQDESSEAGTPEVSISISNVNGLVTSQLAITRDSLVPFEITERLYASNDLESLAKSPPITLEIVKAQSYGSYVVLTASYRDPGNTAVPKLTFKLSEYPGLYAT
jgi:hypothetical protein